MTPGGKKPSLCPATPISLAPDSCLACGSVRFSPPHAIDKKNLKYWIFECVQCGLAHTRPFQKAGISFATDVNCYAQVVNPLSAGFRKHHDLLLKLLKTDPISDSKRLLEVGSNRGDFLAAALEKGYDVWGIEPAPGSSRLTPSLAKLLPEPIETISLPDDFFDAAVAIQIIEHLRDPNVLMAKVAKSLKCGGLFYLETPNYRSLARRIRTSDFIRINIGPGHPHLFTKESLLLSARRHGFRSLRTWTFFKALSAYGRGPLRPILVECLNKTFGAMGFGNTLALLAVKT